MSLVPSRAGSVSGDSGCQSHTASRTASELRLKSGVAQYLNSLTKWVFESKERHGVSIALKKD